MKLPESIGHKQAVEFVKGALEEELGVQLEKKKIPIGEVRYSDLIYDSPDEAQSIVVIIRDNNTKNVSTYPIIMSQETPSNIVDNASILATGKDAWDILSKEMVLSM